MNLTKLTDNLNIIQGLADKPTQTASQLKEAFDTAGNKIKSYINDHLTSELDSEVYSKTETDTLLGAKANTTDVSSLIQYEDVTVTAISSSSVTAIGSTTFTKPLGYKVLSANVISTDLSVVASICAIQNNNIWVYTHGEYSGYEATVTVRMIYIKE